MVQLLSLVSLDDQFNAADVASKIGDTSPAPLERRTRVSFAVGNVGSKANVRYTKIKARSSKPSNEEKLLSVPITRRRKSVKISSSKGCKSDVTADIVSPDAIDVSGDRKEDFLFPIGNITLEESDSEDLSHNNNNATDSGIVKYVVTNAVVKACDLSEDDESTNTTTGSIIEECEITSGSSSFASNTPNLHTSGSTDFVSKSDHILIASAEIEVAQAYDTTDADINVGKGANDTSEIDLFNNNNNDAVLAGTAEKR